MTCVDQKTVGNLLTHEVRFNGPGAVPCELPEQLQGQIVHEFSNLSIYPYTCVITAATQPPALTVVGPPATPPVHVPIAKKKLLRVTPGTGTASQRLEHVAGTGLGLPFTGSASFTTTVTAPWGTCPPPATAPSVSIDLAP
jgi:hypothetical protein